MTASLLKTAYESSGLTGGEIDPNGTFTVKFTAVLGDHSPWVNCCKKPFCTLHSHLISFKIFH